MSSEMLAKRKKKTKRQKRGLDRHSLVPYLRLLVMGTVVIFVISVGTGAFVHGAQVRKQLLSYSGDLIPGNFPTPENACNHFVPQGALRVLLGPMVAVSDRFPQNVVVLEGEPVLIMNKFNDGHVTLSTDIYDRNHDIVAEIKDNKYDVDSSVYKMSRDSLRI